MEEKSLEERVEDLEKAQYEMLLFIKDNSELINNILKRERIQTITLLMLAISQLLIALRPIIQHLLGN